MKDITGAIAAEEQYIHDRINKGIEVSIYDYLTPYGYTVLEEYFKDKHYYQLAHCGVQQHKCTPETAIPEIMGHIQSRTPGIWIPETDHIFAWGCNDKNEIDHIAFDGAGIPIYDVPAYGGTIISGPEDIGVAVIIPSSIGVGTRHIMARLKEFLEERVQSDDIIEIDGNDMLRNGHKFIGVTQNSLDDIGIYVFWGHVSFVNREELINQLCPPATGKLPGSIGDAITREELIAEIKSWFGLGE